MSDIYGTWNGVRVDRVRLNLPLKIDMRFHAISA